MDRRTAFKRIVTALSALLLAAAAPSCIAPESAHCDQMSSCGACTSAGSGCGWCDGVCVGGTSLGPSSGTCSAWAFDRCGGGDEPQPQPTTDTGAPVPFPDPTPTDPSEGDSGPASDPDASFVDCSVFTDCVSCAAISGCAFCGDFGTCESANSAFSSCMQAPITSPSSCTN